MGVAPQLRHEVLGVVGSGKPSAAKGEIDGNAVHLVKAEGRKGFAQELHGGFHAGADSVMGNNCLAVRVMSADMNRTLTLIHLSLKGGVLNFVHGGHAHKKLGMDVLALRQRTDNGGSLHLAGFHKVGIADVRIPSSTVRTGEAHHLGNVHVTAFNATVETHICSFLAFRLALFSGAGLMSPV